MSAPSTASPAATTSTLEPGFVVGNVRLVRTMGAGGMGEVWEARHLRLDERRVVKFIQARRTETGHAELLRRFEREATTHVVLRHPVAPILHDYGVINDERPYIIMEYIDGRTLKAEIAEYGPMGLGRALAIVRQIADFLNFAHSRDIVHRDLKPSNVMIARDPGGAETVKVIDFGIVKRLGEAASTDATDGFIGTVEFAAPEQLDGRAGPASDQFSLGCVLYNLLTGRAPFRRETTSATVKAVMTDHPPPPSAVVAHIPEAIDTIVLRLLAKSPLARFPDMASVSAALTGALPSEAPRFDDVDAFDETQTSSEGLLAVPSPAPAQGRPAGRIALAAAVLGLLALVLWLARPGGTEAPAAAGAGPPSTAPPSTAPRSTAPPSTAPATTVSAVPATATPVSAAAAPTAAPGTVAPLTTAPVSAATPTTVAPPTAAPPARPTTAGDSPRRRPGRVRPRPKPGPAARPPTGQPSKTGGAAGGTFDLYLYKDAGP